MGHGTWPWCPSGLLRTGGWCQQNQSRVQIHLLRKNKLTSGQRNKSDSRTKYLDKPVRKPKEIETCDKRTVFWRKCVQWRPRSQSPSPSCRTITTEIPGNSMTTSRWHSHTRPHCQYTMDETTSNISTRREVVEFRWNTQNTQTLPYWEYWEYMGWKGTERQCGNSPHTSVLVDINNWTPHAAIIFPLEGRLWNFGGTHKIHKSFLTESTGSTWVGKEQRDNVESVHTHLFWWTLIIWKQEVYLQS